MTREPADPPVPPDELPDEEFEQLLAEVDRDPIARAVYEDTVARAALLTSGPAIRKRHKLSQKQVALAMGTTQSAVSDLESGRNEPQLRTLQRYARALGLRFDFALSDASVPLSDPAVTPAVLSHLKETTLSSLLTTLVKQSKEQGQTLQALAESLLLPQTVVRPVLSLLQAEGWTTSVGVGSEEEYALVDQVANVIGVSLDRDKVVGVLMDMDGDVLLRAPADLPDSTRETVCSVTSAVIASLFRGSVRPVLGVGVSLAGVVEPDSGRVRFAPDLRSVDDEWSDVDLEKELQRRVQEEPGAAHLLVAVENDANALAAWEYLRRGDESVSAVLLSGVGIGAGFVLEGKVVHGAHSAAGEGGHIVVDATGPACRAGQPHGGCLETMVSAQGVLVSLGLPASTWGERDEGLVVVNDRVLRGDAEAIEALEEAGRALGRWLSGVILLLDPARLAIYAHPYISQSQYATAETFQRGLSFSLSEGSSSRLGFVDEPRLEWHPLEEDTGAVAAGAAALWHFLKRPSHWAPSMLPAGAESGEPAWT